MADKSKIDSPMTPFKEAPTTLDQAPGDYNKHPNVGPAGDSGGFPLKFTDNSVKGIMPEGPSMEPVPAATKKE